MNAPIVRVPPPRLYPALRCRTCARWSPSISMMRPGETVDRRVCLSRYSANAGKWTRPRQGCDEWEGRKTPKEASHA